MKTVRNLKNLFCSPHSPVSLARSAYSLSLEIYFYCAKRENIKSFPFSLRIYLATRSNLECLNNPSLGFRFNSELKTEANARTNLGGRGILSLAFIGPSVSLSNQKVVRRGVVCHERLFSVSSRCKQDEDTEFVVLSISFRFETLVFPSTRYVIALWLCVTFVRRRGDSRWTGLVRRFLISASCQGLAFLFAHFSEAKRLFSFQASSLDYSVSKL